MGRRGPQPKPSELNRLAGHPGHRPINAEEPRPDPAPSVAPPTWLAGEARAVWSEVAPELHRLHLLSKIDVSAFAAACRWWAIYRQADRALRRGLLVHNKANGKIKNPYVDIAHKAFAAAVDVFVRFGVTPSARVALKAPTPRSAGDSPNPGLTDDPHDQLAARRAQRAQPKPA